MEAAPTGLPVKSPPPQEFSLPPGFVLQKAPLEGTLHEIFVFMLEESLEKLKLPDHFTEMFCRYDQGWILRRDKSDNLETWKMDTLHDGARRVFLAEGWSEFASYYELKPGFLLVFHHREGTNKFLVKFFDGSHRRVLCYP
jgi:hypothetical protein